MEIRDWNDIREKEPLYVYLGKQCWRRAVGYKERKRVYDYYKQNEYN